MENTTNYSLRKYQSGDLFNPLTMNNPNLDDIDTDMKAISDRAIGRATELVSQGVHAITLLDTDCKTFKFVATGNYSAGETFTVNGIQANAYTPSGSALVSNAFVTGSVVLGTLNEDGTAITFYVTGSAVADDSLKLGGELPSYYATQLDMTRANTEITNLKNQAGNTSIVGIGDGTLSGAVSSLNNNLTAIQLRSFYGSKSGDSSTPYYEIFTVPSDAASYFVTVNACVKDSNPLANTDHTLFMNYVTPNDTTDNKMLATFYTTVSGKSTNYNGGLTVKVKAGSKIKFGLYVSQQRQIDIDASALFIPIVDN